MHYLRATVLLLALMIGTDADELASAPTQQAAGDVELPSTDVAESQDDRLASTKGAQQTAIEGEPSSVEPADETVAEVSGRIVERGTEPTEAAGKVSVSTPEENPPDSSSPARMQVCSAGDGDSSKCQIDKAGAKMLSAGRETGTGNVRPAPKSLNGKSLDPDNEEGKWWLGDMESMTSRAVVAMDTSAVVLCYGRLDRGGCRFSSIDAKEQKLASGLLPPLAWSEEQLFNTGKIGQVQARRLDAGHFALCFERAEDSSIGCLVASVNSTASPQITLGEALMVGSASHLLSLVVTTTTRFSMCHRLAARGPDGGDCYSSIGTGAPCTTAHCQVGEVDGMKLRWADAPPHITKI